MRHNVKVPTEHVTMLVQSLAAVLKGALASISLIYHGKRSSSTAPNYSNRMDSSPQASPSCFSYARTTGLQDSTTIYSLACGKTTGKVDALVTPVKDQDARASGSTGSGGKLYTGQWDPVASKMADYILVFRV